MNLSERYELKTKLGGVSKRKFSAVYKAIDKTSRQPVIIKIVEKKVNSAVNEERILSESTFHFDAQGLPKVISFTETDEAFYLVKIYEPGVPLWEYLAAFRRKEKITKLTDVLHKLAPLFEELKQSHCVHLDLKPSNILVHEEESSIRVALIDFGLASRLPATENRKTLFPLGYAAPELILNRLDLVDQRTDFFALGICIWQCLDGKLPLVHTNPSITTNLQLNHPLLDSDKISKEHMHVLKKLCNKHAFRIPPSKLPKVEETNGLIAGMDERYSNYTLFMNDWLQANERSKKWWPF